MLQHECLGLARDHHIGVKAFRDFRCSRALRVMVTREQREGLGLMPQAVALLPQPAMAYGKAAIVGVEGDLEHAAAILHPKLGKPMRAAVGGGEAIIPSATKVAAAGTLIDVPLGNKDNVWSFDELDTMTVCVADAPRPREILVAMVVSDGGRPNPRVGKGRAIV